MGGFTWSVCPPLVVLALVERPLPPNELQVVEIDYRREGANCGAWTAQILESSLSGGFR